VSVSSTGIESFPTVLKELNSGGGEPILLEIQPKEGKRIIPYCGKLVDNIWKNIADVYISITNCMYLCNSANSS
jgi:hypothetical protein